MSQQVASYNFQPVKPAIEAIRDRLAKEPKVISTEEVKYLPWADFRIYRAATGNIKGLFGVAQIFHEGSGKTAKTTEKVLAEGVDMHVVVCRMRDAITARLNRRAK